MGVDTATRQERSSAHVKLRIVPTVSSYVADLFKMDIGLVLVTMFCGLY